MKHSPINRRAALRLGAGIVASGALFTVPAEADPESWRHYPTRLYDFVFPDTEGLTSNATDSWYVAGFLTGQRTGRHVAFITIFCKNRPIADLARADFHTFALFDVDSGEYGTHTLLDFPPLNVIAPPKLSYTTGYLDVAADTEQGRSSWTTRRTATGALDPFHYRLDLHGTDQHGQVMGLAADLDLTNPPAAAGGDVTRGVIECFGQPGTSTCFQTGTRFRGTLTWGDESEPVTGSHGHIDRQMFPAFAGVHAGLLARDRSHEWRAANLDDGTDLSIWRQFDRTDRDSVQAFTGTTRYLADGNRTVYAPDLDVSYTSYVKWPQSMPVFVPPPSPNRWLPSAHTLRSPSISLELTCTPLVAAPAHGLPIEYMIGPVRWAGSVAGKPVSGVGFSERTLALYRDWELADVLRVTVANLPPAAYGPASPTPTALAAIAGQVADAAARSDTLAVLALARTRLAPAIATLNQPFRTDVATVLHDVETAPSVGL